MYRGICAIICLFGVIAMAGCGGKDSNGGTDSPEGQPAGDTAREDPADGASDPQDDEAKEDPDKWLKVTAPEPEGWHKLSKDARNEILNAKYGLMKSPPSEFALIAGHTSQEPPHPTGGTDDDWTEWREGASIVLVYAVSKSTEDVVETLKQHGAVFVEDFDDSKVLNRDSFAGYIHADGEKWLACVSNANGTYMMAALVRSDEDGDVLETYPNQLKPE